MALREEPVIVDLSIPFENAEYALIAYKALIVDYHGDSIINKKLTLQDNILKGEFSGRDVKKVRSFVSSFFQSVVLVCRTIDRFHV